MKGTLSAVGLMSGTSADGVSAALVRVGPGRALRVIRSTTIPFTTAERGRILSLGEGSASDLSGANMRLGERFAAAARKVMKGDRVDVIGSHGQTVTHEPGRHTLQIAEASVIAERTGVTTVADFRPRDIAAGGEGAPLIPFFDFHVFGAAPRPIALQNIGGIGNVTVVGGGIRRPLGFDTGPGNCLIDEAVRIATKGRLGYDRGGAIARKGRLDGTLLKRLLDHPYFRRKPPKSTGRELFSRAFLLERCGRDLARRPADVIATLTHFTARTIGDAIERWLPRVGEVVVSGGGAFNPKLLEELEWTVFPAPVRPISVYGIEPLAKEPAAFALFAALALQGEANTLPSATGARHPVVAGKIVPGRNWRPLMKRLHG